MNVINILPSKMNDAKKMFFHIDLSIFLLCSYLFFNFFLYKKKVNTIIQNNDTTVENVFHLQLQELQCFSKDKIKT